MYQGACDRKAAGGTGAVTPRHRARTSDRLLFFALTVTIGVVLAGSGAMWTLFTSPPAKAVTTPQAATDSADRLVIAVARTAGGPAEWMTYAKAIAQMGTDTGLDIRVRYVPDRRGVVRLFSAHQVDAAFICTYCYLELQGLGLVDAAARPMIDGSPRDAAVLVVSAKSPFRSLLDLGGQKVAVSDGTSLAGHAFLYWLADENGLTAEEFFSAIVRNTSQERNLVELAAGRVDATVVNRTQLARWPATTFRIIGSSPEYGTPPFVVRHDLDPSIRDKLRQALLRAMNAPRATEGSSLSGFVPASPEDYEFPRQLLPYASETTGTP